MRVDDPRCLPSVGRSELPSASSIPSRALRPEASVNVHEGVRRTVRRLVSGARAIASFDATSEMATLDLAPAPRRLDPCRSTNGGKRPTASLGHDCTTDLCNACSTRGHAREPGILLRARLPPLSAFAPDDGFPPPENSRAVCRLRGAFPEARHLVLPPTSLLEPWTSSARALLKGTSTTREDREMTPRSHAVWRPSPRPPRGGVAAYAARTERSMTSASVEGRSPIPCRSGQHGPSTAE
jgi:hypothetical protein